jgi:outer membrane lipoprotein
MDWTGWSHCGLWGLMGLMALLGIGCAHAISKTMRVQAEPPIPFAQLRANPEAYKDRTVILGGEILQTHNLREGTRLEVLQKPIDRSQAPLTTDSTGGRFMALCDDYLDPAVYAPGRRITVAGRVLGSYTGKVGEVDYVYPLIACQEKHLWPQVVAVPRGYYSYPWWYWDPYVHPWYWRPYRYRFGFHYHPYW